MSQKVVVTVPLRREVIQAYSDNISLHDIEAKASFREQKSTNGVIKILRQRLGRNSFNFE